MWSVCLQVLLGVPARPFLLPVDLVSVSKEQLYAHFSSVLPLGVQ